MICNGVRTVLNGLMVGVFVVLGATGIAVAQKTTSLDKIVAVVNDDIITQSQLQAGISARRHMLSASGQPMPKPSVLRKSVLDELILEHLQLSLAEKNAINVTEKEIDQTIAMIAKRNTLSISAFKQSLKQAGFQYKQYRHMMKKQIVIQRLQQRVIAPNVHVSEADVRAFIKTYRAKNKGKKAHYHLWDWVIPVQATDDNGQWTVAEGQARQLIKQLKKGVSTETLVSRLRKKYGDEAMIGGDLGWRREADLPRLFIRPLRRLSVKGTSTPLRADNGIHVLQLLDKRDPSRLSLKMARTLAYQQAFQKELETWWKSLRAAAYIRIGPVPR